MAQLVVVDTDVLIDFLRGSGPAADLVEQLLRDDAFLVTVITRFESAQGANYPEEREKIEPLLSHSELPLTPIAASTAGDLSRELRRAGEALATADILQAGICLALGLPLATKNVRHFERIPGLTLVSPE